MSAKHIFEDLHHQYTKGTISAAKFATLGFLILGHDQNSKDFIQNTQGRREIKELFILEDEKLADYILQAKFKGVRSKVNQSLARWLRQEWPLVLLFEVPSVYEVLSLQAQGQRCATVFNEVIDWKTPKLGKANAFEFLVHDLEHAYQYFSSFHHEQVRLYKTLLALYDEGYFNELLEGPLKSRVQYLLSDMNTHPAHAISYLRAIWVEYASGQRQKEKLVQERMEPLHGF